jgi:hypothetical protein
VASAGISPTLSRAIDVCLQYLGVRGAKRLTEGTVTAVLADGTLEVGGAKMRTTGTARGLQAGTKVPVLWSRGNGAARNVKPTAVIMHQVQRGAAPTVSVRASAADVFEELSVRVATVGGAVQLWYRTAALAVALGVEAAAPGLVLSSLVDPKVRWGPPSTNTFLLYGLAERLGVIRYVFYVFTISHAPDIGQSRSAPSVSFVRLEVPGEVASPMVLQTVDYLATLEGIERYLLIEHFGNAGPDEVNEFEVSTSRTETGSGTRTLAEATSDDRDVFLVTDAQLSTTGDHLLLTVQFLDGVSIDGAFSQSVTLPDDYTVDPALAVIVAAVAPSLVRGFCTTPDTGFAGAVADGFGVYVVNHTTQTVLWTSDRSGRYGADSVRDHYVLAGLTTLNLDDMVGTFTHSVAWDGVTSFVPGDVVSFTTDVLRFYVCIEAPPSNEDPTNATYWLELGSDRGYVANVTGTPTPSLEVSVEDAATDETPHSLIDPARLPFFAEPVRTPGVQTVTTYKTGASTIGAADCGSVTQDRVVLGDNTVLKLNLQVTDDSVVEYILLPKNPPHETRMLPVGLHSAARMFVAAERHVVVGGADTLKSWGVFVISQDNTMVTVKDWSAPVAGQSESVVITLLSATPYHMLWEHVEIVDAAIVATVYLTQIAAANGPPLAAPVSVVVSRSHSAPDLYAEHFARAISPDFMYQPLTALFSAAWDWSTKAPGAGLEDGVFQLLTLPEDSAMAGKAALASWPVTSTTADDDGDFRVINDPKILGPLGRLTT